MGSKFRFSKCNFQKSSCLKLQGPGLSYLVYSIIYRSSTKVVQIIPLGQNWPRPGGHNFTLNYIRKTANEFFSWTWMGILPNSTGMVPGWSPTEIVQMVSIGCISMVRGQKIGFQNAIFKNLLVWNYKTQSFHIWYISSSRCSLPKLFTLCPLDQNWTWSGGSQF